MIELISDALSTLVIFWGRLTQDVHPDILPVYAYIGAGVLALTSWCVFAQLFLGKTLRLFGACILCVLLFTPGFTIDETGDNFAPAFIGSMHAFLMGDAPLGLVRLAPILLALSGVLGVVAIWHLVRHYIASQSNP